MSNRRKRRRIEAVDNADMKKVSNEDEDFLYLSETMLESDLELEEENEEEEEEDIHFSELEEEHEDKEGEDVRLSELEDMDGSEGVINDLTLPQTSTDYASAWRERFEAAGPLSSSDTIRTWKALPLDASSSSSPASAADCGCLCELPRVTTCDGNSLTASFSIPGDYLPDQSTSLLELGFKRKLVERWEDTSKECEEKEKIMHEMLLPLFSSFNDVLFASLEETYNDVQLRRTAMLHILNHVMRSRATILRNNTRIRLKARKLKGQKLKEEVTEVRDQGFTRCRVLILAPFRHFAYSILTTLLDVLPPEYRKEVSNQKRFEDEFGPDPMGPDASSFSKKPLDFQQIFKCNMDDCFRVGISISPNSNTLRLFAPFYSSDIIIASPLGIRMIIKAEGEPHREYDFLSSLDIVFLYHAEIIAMQNWEHLTTVLNACNHFPLEDHNIDYSRLHPWHLDQHMSKRYRQNIILSAYLTPEINRLVKQRQWCDNARGCVIIRPRHYFGQLGNLQATASQIPAIQHVFHRIPCRSLALSCDDRFDFFIQHVVPKIRSKQDGGTLIFISSYYDFVRLRNHFHKNIDDLPSFTSINEYDTQSHTSKARACFALASTQDNHKKRNNIERVDFMLYSERLHFFRRYKIRGVKHIVWYGLPTTALFYSELLNLIISQSSSNHPNPAISSTTCLALFTKYDAFTLERIVGTDRCSRLLVSDNSTHMFC